MADHTETTRGFRRVNRIPGMLQRGVPQASTRSQTHPVSTYGTIRDDHRVGVVRWYHAGEQWCGESLRATHQIGEANLRAEPSREHGGERSPGKPHSWHDACPGVIATRAGGVQTGLPGETLPGWQSRRVG